MNLSSLYRDGKVCKLCELDGEHADECLGEILERLTWEVRYDGSNCARGCCGSTRGSASGDTLEEAIRQAAARLSGTIDHSCEARLVAPYGYTIGDLVTAEMKRQASEREAQEAAEEAAEAERDRAETRERSLAALELERSDLVPDAYERRKREIEAA